MIVRYRSDVFVVVVAVVAAIVLWAPAHGHGGGVPQLTGQIAGPYRIYAWSQPDPIRAGETHLTVGVTLPSAETKNADVGEQDEVPVTDAAVLVTYHPVDGGTPVTVRAMPQGSLSSVYYESDAVIPAPGLWRIEVAVTGLEGSGSATFDTQVVAVRRLKTPLVAVVGAVSIFALLLLAVRARRGDSSNDRGNARQLAHRVPAETSAATQQTNV